MVKANRPAASQFVTTHSVNTDSADKTRPKASASPGVTRPEGTGRVAVRAIFASMSASYHMLSAPEAPAPTAIASSAAKPITGWGGCGAISMPASAVSTTSDITRGFRSAR